MSDQNLDIHYGTIFVSNEHATPNYRSADCRERAFVLEHSPVTPGTLEGSIFGNGGFLCHFIVTSDGLCSFTHDDPEASLIFVKGTLDHRTGELNVVWNDDPGENVSLVVDYEYDRDEDDYNVQKAPAKLYKTKSHWDMDEDCPKKCEPEPRTWKTMDGRTIQSSTFKNFPSHDKLMDLARKAEVRMFWDFNSALGDTIKEKYESLYFSCISLNKELISKGAAGLFWIVCNEEVCSIFETATAGFFPVSSSEWDDYSWINGHKAQGIAGVEYKGMINAKWRLYGDHECPSDLLLMGANDWVQEDMSHYGVMKLCNFIW